MSFADGGGSSGMGGGGGMGHYKGVMLCNRPFAGTTAPNRSKLEGRPAGVFTCGKVPEAPGLNIPIATKERQPKRTNKDNALNKHKKWLADLQKARDELESRLLEEVEEKKASMQRFQEQERQKREISKQLSTFRAEAKDSSMYMNTSEAKGKSADEITAAAAAAALRRAMETKDDSPSRPETSMSDSKPVPDAKDTSPESIKKFGKNRPAWALTESIAADVAEAKEADDEDDLLDFAAQLDYENVIADVEVSAVMGKLRDRITALEKEVAQEEKAIEGRTGENLAAYHAKKRELLQLMAQAEASLSSGESGSDSLGAARALLNEEEDLMAVHSTKSAATLLNRAKEKIASLSHNPPSSFTQPGVFNEPKIVIHEPDEGSRLEVKHSVSKLPYMHRNPAI